MKIKRKEYKSKLRQAYYDGYNEGYRTGLKIGIENPQDARILLGLGVAGTNLQIACDRVADAFKKVFGGG